MRFYESIVQLEALNVKDRTLAIADESLQNNLTFYAFLIVLKRTPQMLFHIPLSIGLAQFKTDSSVLNTRSKTFYFIEYWKY